MRRFTMAKDLIPRLKEGRMIKLGIGHPIKGKAGRRPERFDHFKIYTRDKDAAGEFIPDEVLQEQLEGIYGAPLRRLKIVFLYNDLRLNFPNGHRAFKGTRLFCEGDAERFYRYHYEKKKENGRDVLLLKNTEEGDCIPWPDNGRGDPCQFKARDECKRWGELTCMLPEFDRLGVVFKFRTTSNNSVRNIFSMLLWTAKETGGVIAGIPFMLTCSMTDLETKDGRKVKQPIVNIEYEGSKRALIEAATQEAQLISAGKRNMKLIEDAAEAEFSEPTTRDEEVEIASEFHPEPEPELEPMRPPQRVQPNGGDAETERLGDTSEAATAEAENGNTKAPGDSMVEPTITRKEQIALFALATDKMVSNDYLRRLIKGFDFPAITIAGGPTTPGSSWAIPLNRLDEIRCIVGLGADAVEAKAEEMEQANLEG